MKTLLIAMLFVVTTTLSAASVIGNTTKPTNNTVNKYEQGCEVSPHMYLAQRNIGQCMADCASEQGMCIGQCQGNPQCMANCAAAHGRCVARCN